MVSVSLDDQTSGRKGRRELQAKVSIGEEDNAQAARS